MDLNDWRKHIRQAVADDGFWVGIANEDGMPFMEVPPFAALKFPRNRMAVSEFELTLHAPADTPIKDELIAEGIGVQDEAGRLVPASGPTRMLIVEVPGQPRLAYFITHATISGAGAPDTLVIKGVDAVDCLAFWPGPSIPLEVQKAKFQTWNEDASGEAYKTPRRLAQVPFATAADGYTMKGRARSVIRDFVDDSLKSVNALMGWAGDEHAVVDYSGGVDDSREIYLRTSDDYILDTIAAPLKNAGLYLRVDMWWPGDDPVVVRGGSTKSWDRPMLIIRIDSMKEA
ncbi:hypothetical protein ACW675_07205 [Corynebacterium aurimucosum]